MSPRFSAAIEPALATVEAAAAPAGLAQPLAVARKREARFLDESLRVAPVAVALRGAARRAFEVEPAARFVEAVAEGTAEGAPE